MNKKKFATHLGTTLAVVGVIVLLHLLTSSDQPCPGVGEAEATPIPAEKTGIVKGTVRFTGPLPERRTLSMNSDCQGLHPNDVYDNAELVKEGHVQNAVVYVKTGLETFKFATPQDPVSIDQLGCLFRPRVTAGMTCQPIHFSNSDPLIHNVAGPSLRMGFNLSHRGAEQVKKFEAAGFHRLECSYHAWMTARLCLFSHPYFAVTGEKGEFELKDRGKDRGLPAGEYTVEAWHETFGTQTLKVSVEPLKTVELEFTFEGKTR